MMTSLKLYAQQENLTEERLSAMHPACRWESVEKRPMQNLIELMHWAKNNFSDRLRDKANAECFIHNKVSIDGSFLQFCEENNTEIKCLYRDSIASWQTEEDTENFLAQGVFIIKTPAVEFIHCALFHKGNQGEDEVSFFIIIQDSLFNKYIEFRNAYDKWLMVRDRANLEVHVVGAEPYRYSKDLSWNDIFLPDDLKEEIKLSIEGFFQAKEKYKQAKVPWKRGVLFFGEPGNGKTSLIKTIMSSYDFKPVTIQPGLNTNEDLLKEAFSYACEQGPSLLFLEDIDDLLQSTSHRMFLNLMDGVDTKEGLFVIGTANNISGLKLNITDRPSRFDRKWEIPIPDLPMSIKYLNKWFSEFIFEADIIKTAETTVSKSFSYAYLQELYLSSVFLAIRNNKDNPDLSDFKQALAQLVSEKKVAKTGFKSKNQKSLDLGGLNKE